MRSDYGLYVIAIICFAIAGGLAAANIPGYTLSEASGITVFMIFLLIGIISAAVGYSTKPKEMMPTTQPTLTASMREKETPITTQQVTDEIQPPPPTPIEQMTTAPAEEHKPELAPEIVVAAEQSAPSPPTSPEAPSPETAQPVTPAVEEAVEEKPKTTRRRRKKAQ